MKTLTMILFLLVSFHVLATDRPWWTDVNYRTQGGGVLWFPGSGTASNVDDADLLAKGRALDYMKSECEGFHKNVLFIDRYVENSHGKVTVWIRASVKQYDECKVSTKNESKALKQIYVDYKVMISKVDFRSCSNNYDLFCAQQASDEFNNQQFYSALKYARFSCKMGEEAGCKIAANITNWLMQ